MAAEIKCTHQADEEVQSARPKMFRVTKQRGEKNGQRLEEELSTEQQAKEGKWKKLNMGEKKEVERPHLAEKQDRKMVQKMKLECLSEQRAWKDEADQMSTPVHSTNDILLSQTNSGKVKRNRAKQRAIENVQRLEKALMAEQQVREKETEQAKKEKEALQ